MPREEKTFEVKDAKCTRLAASGKAILVEAEQFDEPVWVPISQVHDDSEVWKPGDEGKLVVTEWIAMQKGWV
jgi:hypothetical protein